MAQENEGAGRVRENSRLDTRMFYNFPTDHVSSWIPNWNVWDVYPCNNSALYKPKVHLRNT